MNSPSDDLDSEILGHFHREHRVLPSDPFIGVTAERIRAARRRRTLVRNALQITGIAVLVLGANWLIKASAFMSMKLDSWFTVGLQWLAAPLGSVAALCAIIAAVGLWWKSQRRV